MRIFGKRASRKKRSGQSGLATTEFALLMSLFLVPLLWGLVEASEAMTVNRRVTSAVNSLADLAAQSESFSEGDLDALISDVGNMVNPASGPTHPLTISVVSVVLDSDQPKVDWSRNESATAPYSAGSVYTKLSDQSLLPDGASLIVVEMNYSYQLTFFSHFITSPILFQRLSIRYPRLTNKVVLCAGTGACP